MVRDGARAPPHHEGLVTQYDEPPVATRAVLLDAVIAISYINAKMHVAGRGIRIAQYDASAAAG
jgi:hypothetical protein